MSIIPFSFDAAEVRVVERDGEALFVARDVAAALGYAKPADAVRNHCKGVFETKTPTAGGIQTVKVIREPDVYRLIVKSKMPSAERFEAWVFEEVLPQIRKTGAYQPQTEPTPTTPMQHAVSDMHQWKSAAALFGIPEAVALVEGVKHVEHTYEIDFKPLLLASPMMDDIKDDEVMLEPSEIGKRIGYTGREVNIALCKAGLQAKRDGEWVPTEAAHGYTSRHFWMSKSSGKSGYNYKWNLEFVRQQLGK